MSAFEEDKWRSLGLTVRPEVEYNSYVSYGNENVSLPIGVDGEDSMQEAGVPGLLGEKPGVVNELHRESGYNRYNENQEYGEGEGTDEIDGFRRCAANQRRLILSNV